MGLLRLAPNILLITRASGSGPASPVLAGPLFHSSQKKFLVVLQSVLYSMAEKVIKVQG